MMRKVIFSTAALSLLIVSASAGAIDATPKPANSVATTQATQSDSGRKVAGIGGIFGCSADGNKQTIGAVAGGALGGFLGNRIAGHGSRTLGTLLGGVLGAAAGSAVGCKLQKNDQAKAERALEQAVLTGQNQDWQSDETGASGRVEVGQDIKGVDLANLRLAAGVEPADGYTKVGGAYVSTTNANIRSAPGTNARVLGLLATGQRVWVPASVKGQPWVLVSDQGVGQGYVSAPLLKKAVAMASSNGCKLVKQTISTPGGAPETETLQACKGANGEWTMTRV
jgi:outer membrane lipoprotein SlyB